MRRVSTYSVIIAAVLLLTAGWSGTVLGQDDITLQLELDRTKIGMNETARLTMTVSMAGQRQLPEPNLPPLPMFEIYSAGNSSSFQMTNNQVSYSMSYKYILAPKREGTFPIRSAWLVVDGERYESNELSIEVVGSARDAAGDASGEGLDSEGNTKDIFLTAEVDKKTAYVNEQVTLIIKFYRAVNLLSQANYNPPSTTDFWEVEGPPQGNYSQIINGRKYFVSEIKQPLFPTKPGRLTIGSAQVTAAVPDRNRQRSRDPFSLFDDMFERGKNVTVRSSPLTIQVNPLPAAGKTADFSGGVGDFKISATVDKNQVVVNEGIMLTVKISGTGNIKSAPEPTFPELDGFRIEKSSSTHRVSFLGNQIGGTKTFEYLLIPRLPGTHTIESLTLNHFNPDRKAYVTAATDPITLTVGQGELAAGSEVPYNMVSGQTINLKETDIRFIKTENGHLVPRGRILLTSPVFLAVAALPLVIVLGGFFDVRRRRRLEGDVAYARLRRANAEARRRLKKAEEYLRGNDSEAFYAELSAVVYTFIADKFNLSAQGLTTEAVEGMLQEHNVSEQLREETAAVIGLADFGRFAGASGGAGGDMGDHFERAKKLVIALEEAL